VATSFTRTYNSGTSVTLTAPATAGVNSFSSWTGCTSSNTVATLVLKPDPNAGVTGMGSSGLPSKANHIQNSRVVFILPAQMVCYRIEWLKLDPSSANGVPCLVRNQATYDTSGFPTDPTKYTQQLIAENVSGFKVMLSVDSGQSWVGAGAVPTTPAATPGQGFSAGWDLGLRAALNTALATAGTGRQGFKTTAGNDQWFRSNPTLVRVDVTTRTATQRADYNKTNPNALAYGQQTQTLVMVPRHSGLPID